METFYNESHGDDGRFDSGSGGSVQNAKDGANAMKNVNDVLDHLQTKAVTGKERADAAVKAQKHLDVAKAAGTNTGTAQARLNHLKSRWGLSNSNNNSTGEEIMGVNATGPLEQGLRLKAKDEIAKKIEAIVAAGVHSVGDVVSSEGWCTLPSGSTLHTTHSDCTKRGGLWSPAQYIGGRGFGGGVGEESPSHEATESPAQESAEGEGSPAGGAPAGGGAGGGPAA